MHKPCHTAFITAWQGFSKKYDMCDAYTINYSSSGSTSMITFIVVSRLLSIYSYAF